MPETSSIVFRRSFADIMKNAEAFSWHFYENYFKRNPSVVPLFAETHMPDMRRKLTASLIYLVNIEDDPEARAAVRELARKHIDYRVQPRHFDGFVDAFRDAATKVSAENFEEVEEEWMHLLGIVRDMFLDEIAPS